MADQTFHQSISKILCFSQLFAILPVSNISSTKVERVQYVWFSFPVFYTSILFSLNLLEFGTLWNLILRTGIYFSITGALSLFVVCCLEQMFFWRLATRWPSIIKFWRQVEGVFLRPPYSLYSKGFNMKSTMFTVTFVVLLCAFVEHTALLYNSFHKSKLELEQCDLNITLWELLYRRERMQLYLVLPYRVWILPLAEWTNLSLAYVRSFTDVFIMCVSIGLAARFRQLHLRISTVEGQCMSDLFWREVRHDYLSLKKLLRVLNKELAVLILLCCGNNMYFVCFQLFNSFQNIGVDAVAVCVFWFSLIFAIVRTVVTLYIAATVHDYTAKILSTLRNVPSNAWSLEVERFGDQLALDVTALSGNGLFFLTRKLILTMFSTIVTYELMVSSVINKGSIQQKVDYCSKFWIDNKENEDAMPMGSEI